LPFTTFNGTIGEKFGAQDELRPIRRLATFRDRHGSVNAFLVFTVLVRAPIFLWFHGWFWREVIHEVNVYKLRIAFASGAEY